MKLSKRTLMLICIAGILFCFGVVRESREIIELVNKRYEIENSRNSELEVADRNFQTDIDKAISHSVEGTGAAVLPVNYEQDFTIYEDDFYVTVDRGQTWLLVPDDMSLGYARISSYTNTISSSNIYRSGEKISIIYGGRGPENISIITTDSRGAAWSVGSLSQTATQDLENGYGNMHIDFIDNGQTGYLAAIQNEGTTQEKILVFWSVNTGVVWDSVRADDPLYEVILAHFELQEA